MTGQESWTHAWANALALVVSVPRMHTPKSLNNFIDFSDYGRRLPLQG